MPGQAILLSSPLFLSALSLFGLSPLLWFLFLWFVLCFLMVFRLCFFFGWIGRVNTRSLLLFCCCFLFFPSLVFRLSSSALWVFFLFCLSVFSLFFFTPPLHGFLCFYRPPWVKFDPYLPGIMILYEDKIVPVFGGIRRPTVLPLLDC